MGTKGTTGRSFRRRPFRGDPPGLHTLRPDELLGDYEDQGEGGRLSEAPWTTVQILERRRGDTPPTWTAIGGRPEGKRRNETAQATERAAAIPGASVEIEHGGHVGGDSRQHVHERVRRINLGHVLAAFQDVAPSGVAFVDDVAGLEGGKQGAVRFCDGSLLGPWYRLGVECTPDMVSSEHEMMIRVGVGGRGITASEESG